MRTVTERFTRKPVFMRIGLGGCLLAVLLCIGSLAAAIITGSVWVSGPQPITITDVILTTGVDAQGQPIDDVTRFAPTVERIYCVVTVQAPKPINMGARWYYKDILIFEQAQTVDQRGYWWIRPTGEAFPEGQYRVEIYLAKESSRTVYFTVGP
jgi:hypothetical protein